MAELNLRAEAAAMQAEAAEKVAGVEHDLEEHRAAHAELLRQVRALNEQLAESLETRRLLEEDLERVKMAATRKVFEKAVAQLERIARAIEEAECALAQRRQVQKEREELLRADPVLEEDVRQYRKFEAMPAELLAELPEYYRQSALAAHQQLRQRLSACLTLDDLELQLSAVGPISIGMVFAQRADLREFYLVTPFPVPVSELAAAAPHAIPDAVMDLLLRLALEPEWRLSDLEEKPWSGFRALVMTGEYEGPDEPVEAVQASLQKLADASGPLAGLGLAVELAALGYDIWSLGLAQESEWVGTVAEPPTETVTAPAGDIPPMIPARTPLGDGWYYVSDLVSWDRPLKVVADSQWNVSARRLRTMLMRMVSQGLVGDNKIPKERLWSGLPEPHLMAAEEGVMRLIEGGVLRVDRLDGLEQDQVSINPEMLGQLEVLINRDVNEFWVDLITEPVADTPDVSEEAI